MFLEELGLEESGVNRLIKKAYALLNLQTFITAGEMEVKAWTYKKGWKAPQCAGVIHTDFEKGFIRAEVIKYEDYLEYKTEAAIREAGKLGVEGKEYVVQDGDIMHFIKCAFKGLYQLCRKFSDESYRITQKERNIFNDYFPDGGVQCGEQLVLGENV